MKHLMKDYFGGSIKKLLSFFMEEENLTAEEVNDILSKYKKD
ncbi:MAG: BlaI family penicillinase repressor [Maribacter sp.]|jgi:BlaI family penicillinase repressor